jgi:radical SAM superfamily enzyme YgiQ (UPF0313 family)
MLLIYPPVAKPCEPPAGLARLAGVIRGHGQKCTLLDGNVEGLLFLAGSDPAAAKTSIGTWSRRACRNVDANLAALRTPALYDHPARYRRAVIDLNRVLDLAGRSAGVSLSLANYQDETWSPLQSRDLLQAAAQPERNLFYPWFKERLPRLVEEVRPGLIGFSLNYLSQALTTFAMIGMLRQRFAGLPIVLGGGLVTSWLRNPNWSNPFGGLVDHLVAGPGEGRLLAMAGVVSDGSTHGPAYDDLPLDTYLAPGIILPYAASSGCFWNKCSFCPEKAEGNPYLPLPLERVLEEVQGLVARTSPVLLHFLDNALSPALLQGLARHPPGVPWYTFARVSDLLADEDFCRALRQAGCVMLKLGIESGDQKVLDATHKGIDVAMVSRVLRALHRAGIATYVYLLFGTPAETQKEAQRTLEFVVQHREAITFLNLAIFNMPLAGDDTDTLARRDSISSDLSLYTDFIHPQGWNRREVRHFLDREFRRHPAIGPILRRDPPLFTSNHAPFFC